MRPAAHPIYLLGLVALMGCASDEALRDVAADAATHGGDAHTPVTIDAGDPSDGSRPKREDSGHPRSDGGRSDAGDAEDAGVADASVDASVDAWVNRCAEVTCETDNPCERAECNPRTGHCEYPYRSDGTECEPRVGEGICQQGPFVCERGICTGPRVPPPPGDTCEDALPFPAELGTHTVSGSTRCASPSFFASCDDFSSYGADLSYRWTLDVARRVSIRVLPTESTPDLFLYVVEGCGEAGGYCGYELDGFAELSDLDLVPGPYRVIVDSWDTGGPFQLEVEIREVPAE